MYVDRVRVQLLRLGQLEGALEGFQRDLVFPELESDETKEKMAARGLLRDQPIVQADIGLADAQLRSGRALLTETVRNAWSEVSSTGTISLEQRAAMRIAATHTIRLAIEVVDATYNAAGATAVYDGHPIQRAFQDIHVISQHIQARRTHYEMIGRYRLGLSIDDGRL